jgi:predicted DsbA family dithiol-disulfide isomerase
MSSPLLSASPVAMPIDVVSDVVCPWCYIGKRRLEKALKIRADIAVAVRWRPYFLNPWVPREGMERRAYLEAKFGSAERYAAIAQRISAAAASEGLTYAPDKITRQPNTLDCHRLILWAGNRGNDSRMKQRLMELYFAEGADLTNSEVLVGAAADCGMDAGELRALLASSTDVERVEREANAAKEAGIDGVPCFIFGKGLAVSGAQPPEYLADVMARAAAQCVRQESPERAASRGNLGRF